MFTHIESLRFSVALMIGCGLAVALLEYVTHLLVAPLHSPLRLHAMIDALIVGSLTTFFVGVIVTGARSGRRRVQDEMRVVSELNHHVRNALQVIRDSHYLPEDEQPTAILESVDRIDQTLKRLFPNGKVKND